MRSAATGAIAGRVPTWTPSCADCPGGGVRAWHSVAGVQPQELVVGRVEQIWIYPVRSLSGASLPAVRVGRSGLDGDRAWTVVGDDGAVLRAKELPAMRDVAGTGDPSTDAAALEAVLGRPVRLEATTAGPGGVAPVHLVSRQAIERAAAGDVPEGCSGDDPRANLVLTLGSEQDERAWTGRRLTVGSAVLEVTRTPKHCLGVYAGVRTTGGGPLGEPARLS